MVACQWHLTVPFGKQKDALTIVSNWAKEGFSQVGVVKPNSVRFMVGHIGESPSHIVCEYVFESMADFEASHKVMTGDKFKHFPHELESLITPGSQHWEIWRIAG